MPKSPEIYDSDPGINDNMDNKVDRWPLGIEKMQEREAVKTMLEILNNAAFSPIYSKKVEKVADAIVELGTLIKKMEEQAELTEKDFE